MRSGLLRFTRDVFLIVLAVSILQVQQIQSQQIRLRAGDKLELKVEERPQLDRQLQIDSNGEISIPVVGRIQLRGLRLIEAESTILEELQNYYPSISRIELSLYGEESRRLIYVQGEVINPGRYEFVEEPNVWEAIREAGGATPRAMLEAVRIVHGEGDQQRTYLVDLQRVINDGNFDSLPELKVGDTVIVPERTEQVSSEANVKIMGAVGRPGAFHLTGLNRLDDILITAGGYSEDSNISEIAILRKKPNGSVMKIVVNFEEYLEDGNMENNPIIYSGDLVNVPRGSNALVSIFTSPGYLITLITAAITTATVMMR
ncbi:MAG TPA: polysaccharide biosynthesis/export family protein [Candidatus Krumholzibacteriaceae bacterium]|nr:polysaccharide biosynthesis/export family protein [Candidatus Krumholzibacteriaceae bacterium]